MKLLPLFILAIIAGGVMSVQLGINTRLQLTWAQNPVLTAFISFLGGTLGLLLCLVLTRAEVPSLTGKFTWWQWTGGLFGAFTILMTIIGAPRLGATTMFSLIIAGQLAASLVLDHFGAFGFAQQSISWQRIMGVICVGCGAFLIRKF